MNSVKTIENKEMFEAAKKVFVKQYETKTNTCTDKRCRREIARQRIEEEAALRFAQEMGYVG